MGPETAPELAGGPPPPNTAPVPQSVDSQDLPPVAAVIAPQPRPVEIAQAPPAPAPEAPHYVPHPTYVAPTDAPALAGPPVVTMRPIPNPPGVSRTDRPSFRYTGPTFAPPVRRPAEPRRHATYAPPPMIQPEPARPVAARPVAPRPVAPRPAAPAPMAKAPAPVAKPPVLAVKPPAPAKPAAPAQPPVVAVKPMPTPPVASAVPAKPAPAKPMDKLGQLQAAVGGAVVRGSALTVAPEIADGKPGQVSLSLPASLLDSLKAEAAKLGLGRAARKADVSASLSGEGYSVTPNAQQTATLKSGESATFNWTVAPTTAPKGPLKAEVDAVLKGQAKTQTLSLAAIQSAAPVPPVEAKKGFAFKMPHLPGFGSQGFTLPKFGKGEVAGPPPAPTTTAAAPDAPILRDRTFPVVGEVSGKTQLFAGLGILAVLLAMLISGKAAQKKRLAERRRRYRTYQPMGMGEATGEI